MKVLVVGGGAREHAMLWKLRQSQIGARLFVWPGNPAMADIAERLVVPEGAGWQSIAEVIKQQGIDFVVVGPEQPLAEGFVDICESQKVAAFGPRKNAAMLEASKSFAKDVMKKAGVPTADFQVVAGRDECSEHAFAMLRATGGVVLKASGLAAGKGVFVCRTEQHIEEALYRLYDTDMKSAAHEVVIEELLEGRESSFFCLIGKSGITPLGFAVDYKRLEDGDQGPNTGGMGCYAPVPWLPEDAEQQILQQVVHPLLKELEQRSVHYTGFLYVGLMWTGKGPKVIEFNVRLGDPEAQVLAVYDNKDWGVMIARHLGFDVPGEVVVDASGSRTAVAVVVASRGYPFDTASDRPAALDAAVFDNSALPHHPVVFGASVHKEGEGMLKTGRGRLFTVAAREHSFAETREKVYARVREITRGNGSFRYRSDVGAGL
jgi:phosphoribosylamine--glycine ligase